MVKNELIGYNCRPNRESSTAPMGSLRPQNKIVLNWDLVGGEQSEQEIRLFVPPSRVIIKTMCDMRGVAYGRGM